MRIDVPAGTSAGGTVTSVTGTLPINSSGGNTPAISLDTTGIAALIAYGADTGSANNIAVAVPSWWPAAAVAGMCIRTKANATSTGATAIIVTPSGGAAYASASVVKRTTAGTANPGASGDYVTGGMYELMYDGAAWVLATPSSTTYTAGALTANGVITGNSNNQISGSGAMTMSSGLFTKINSETTVGVGVAFVRGSTLQKAETASADTNVLTVTTPATAGTYRINVAISVASATSGVIAWTASWTDSNGNAQSNIAMPLTQLGTAAPNTTFTTSAAGNYTGSAVIDTNNGAASIVIKWVGGGTTVAKMTAVVERVAV